jgi:hypothetical protein
VVVRGRYPDARGEGPAPLRCPTKLAALTAPASIPTQEEAEKQAMLDTLDEAQHTPRLRLPDVSPRHTFVTEPGYHSRRHSRGETSYLGVSRSPSRAEVAQREHRRMVSGESAMTHTSRFTRSTPALPRTRMLNARRTSVLSSALSTVPRESLDTIAVLDE